MTTATLIPDDAPLYDVARRAQASGQHIITNGTRFALAARVPAGWHAVHVGFKEPQPCAA